MCSSWLVDLLMSHIHLSPAETAGIQCVATTSAVMQIKGAEPDEHHPASPAVQTCGWVPNT